MGKHDKEEYITPEEIDKLQKQHEKEMQQLREGNEILKKAMHVFTKRQDPPRKRGVQEISRKSKSLSTKV